MLYDSSFITLLNNAVLKKLAGPRSFERGEDYFARGRVKGLFEYEGTITANVRGSEEYSVKIWAEDDSRFQFLNDASWS